jgi:cell division protein FtsX
LRTISTCSRREIRQRDNTIQEKMKETMEIMMKKTSFAALMFALAMLVTAPMAFATTVSEAQAMISSLKDKTTTVAISGKSAETKDRPGLVGKLNEAALKVDQAKFCDAIQKLNDFKVKVNQLIAAGKINQDPALGTTGQELLTDADAAIAGITDLVTQSGTTCTF